VKKQTYKVKVALKWRGHWREPDEQLQLLDCEAEALKRADKIELSTVAKTVDSKTTAKKGE